MQVNHSYFGANRQHASTASQGATFPASAQDGQLESYRYHKAAGEPNSEILDFSPREDREPFLAPRQMSRRTPKLQRRKRGRKRRRLFMRAPLMPLILYPLFNKVEGMAATGAMAVMAGSPHRMMILSPMVNPHGADALPKL